MKSGISSCIILTGIVTVGIAACGQRAEEQAAAPAGPQTTVQTSGKSPLDATALPPEVMTVALAARPKLQVTAVEHELRDGKQYYDVAGTVDGVEVELDMTQVGEQWKVVEVQRDIAATDAPAPVTVALVQSRPDLKVTRVIESDQGDGLVIYEFFGAAGEAQDVKVEVKFDGSAASVLTSEWAH